MKRALVWVGVLSLVCVSCGKDRLGVFSSKMAAFEQDPTGQWVYEYSEPRNGRKKSYEMIVLDETVQIDGKTFYRVEPTDRDEALRAVRFDSLPGTRGVYWAIAGDRTRPDLLTVESNAIVEIRGDRLTLGDSQNEPFATLTKVSTDP